jgi:hydrogenase maturation protease
MNRTLVNRIADAVLYEGYLLYPYRPSVKNRQRWTFGGLYPERYCRAQGGTEAWSNQTECLVAGSPETRLEATVRFLHLTERLVGKFVPPLAEWPDGTEPVFQLVEELGMGDQVFRPWQEAEERQVELAGVALGAIRKQPLRQPFRFPERRWLEPLRGPAGEVVGVLVRQQQTLEGSVEAEAAAVADGLFRVTVRVVNHTPLEELAGVSRDAALLRALVSTHTILGVRQGEFVSLLDPPERWRAAAAKCHNVGTWPVLVGEEGVKDTMLSAPIILYDYPQVAPESPGDLFDGTEIDEILTLRILTLTDEEKRAAAALDGRARDLLARTEALAREQLLGLHGTIRGLGPAPGEQA